MTSIEVSKLLGTQSVSKYKGQFRYWKSYFYRHGMTVDSLIANIQLKVPGAVITGSGDHWHAFVGGAKSGTAQDSYLWVTFTVNDADLPVSADGGATKRFLKGQVTTADLMGM